MLLGRFQHSLDEKGRIVLPSGFRDQLHGALFFALGDENEVAIWPDEAFQVKLSQKKAKELEGLEGGREFRRFTSNSGPVKVDGQFRVAIPDFLRTQAGLVRDVTIMGAWDRVEVWDTTRLDRYLASTPPSALGAGTGSGATTESVS